MSTRASDRVRRVLHYFGAGVLDQILLSGASFGAGFVLIRFTNDVAYGQYVLAQSAILLFLSAQGAWLSGPSVALAPRKNPQERRLMLGSLAASQRRFLRRLAPALLVVPAAGYLLGFWIAIVALAAAATIIASWVALERDYMRGILLIYSRPAAVLRADIVYVIVLALGIALAVRSRQAPGPLAIAAFIIAAWAGATAAHKMLAADPGWVSGNAKPFWQEMRPLGLWSVFGAVTYWLFAQSYNYVLATRMDLTAVTSVNAARLVLMPVFVFTTGINNLLTPLAANSLVSSGLPRMLRKLAMITIAVAAIDVVYFVAAWHLRHWLIVDLMHKTIADQDRLLILWACIAMIFLLREVLQAALFALKRVKSMAWLMAISAALSLTLMWRGIAWWGAAAVLIAQVAGECVNLAGLAWLLRNQARLTRQP
jgi:O-antigen/teichoic acid export membrane protein